MPLLLCICYIFGVLRGQLTSLWQIPYRRHYRTAISDTFDVYIEICQEVERRVMAALGRDDPDWRVLNACPPCNYVVRHRPFAGIR